MNLKEAIEIIQSELGELPCMSDEAYDALDYLEDNMENIVEVVRCKDCKHWEQGECGNGCCEYMMGDQFCYSGPDDFCGYGVRRTDDG